MSDDYSDSSGGSSAAGETAPQIANAALRVAVTSRSADTAQIIWHEIRRRIAKGGEFLALQSQGADAGAAIFHLTAEDLASDEAAKVFSATMFQSAAPLNFLVRPFAKADDEAQRRLNAVIAEMQKRTGFLQVPVSKQADEVQSEEGALLFQVRGIANYLLNDPPPLASVTLSEFVSHEKAARRDAKTAKKSSKRDAESQDVSPAQTANKVDREKSPKKRVVKAAKPPAVSSETDKAGKKAAKALQKTERKNEKRAAAKSSDLPSGIAVQPSKGGKKDKSAKKTAHAAAKAGREAKREHRKAEKQAKAGTKPAERQKKDKTAKKAEHAATKTARAAEREKRKTEKQANADAEPGGSEKKDKTAKKAEHAATKTARAAEREKRKTEKQANAGAEPGGSEKKDKSAKKAANAAAKAARAAARENRKAEKQAPGAEQVGGKKDKSASRAERKARKAAAAESGVVAGDGAPREKRKKKDEPESEAGKLERKQAKAARKKEQRQKKKSGGEHGAEGGDDDASRPLRIALNGMDEAMTAGLRLAMDRYLTEAPVEWVLPEQKADIAVYGFDGASTTAVDIAEKAAAITQSESRLRIFLDRTGPNAAEGANPFAAEHRAIALLAGEFESPLIQVDTKIQRYGAGAVSADDIIAASILGVAAGGRLPKHKVPRPPPPLPPDLVEARALAAAPREFLSQLSWNEPKAPRLLWTHASKESAEAFMDRKIVLSEEQTLDITVPITWPEDASGRSSVGDAFGLEFLAGPLNYWYCKANGRDSKKVVEVDAVLKKRGATASQVLSQAGAIIVDFVTTHPLSSSVAWQENAVSRRARVLALYVLCCRMAVKRKIKFDEASCSEAIVRLLELIEALRSEDFYTPCSFDGLQQDCLVIGLALVLRGTAYAEKLLTDGLDRLKTLQIAPGLTADGVWRAGPFSDHCSLLAQFRILLSDFDRADASLIEPIAIAAKKMTVFAEAMQKSNGFAPAFDDSSEKSFARKLSGTRRALAGAGFSKSAPQKNVTPPRITETYVFRDAQYFVSHSTLKVVPASSLVVLHADPVSFARSDPGGVTLAFAYGGTDLLVRAEPPEGTKRRDKAPAFDPALRNGYHIDGVGFESGSVLKANAARLEKSWRGPGWAAARSIDEINPAGSVNRTAIHLKAEHALIVVDELAATGGAQVPFEQFWHIAPGLAAVQSGEAPYRFNLADGGGMTVAFDSRATAAVEPEGEGICIRRVLQMERGVTVSLFQWSAEPATTTLEIKGQAGNWSVDVAGVGFHAQFQLAGEELRYTAQAV